MTAGSVRIAIIAVCLLLTGVLFYLGFKSPDGKVSAAVSAPKADSVFEMDKYLADTKESLPADDRNEIAVLEDNLKNARGSVIARANEDLAIAWASKGEMLIAGYYYEDLAEISQELIHWKKASEAYVSAVAELAGEAGQDFVLQRAEVALGKVLEKDPTDLKAKTDLAMCYATNQRNTMQGIGLLREVLAKDSNNIRAIYLMGALSLESGQYDKAVTRFSKLVSLQPQNPEYHVMLGYSLIKSGNTARGEEEYNIARSLANDSRNKENIESLINSLKN